MTLPIRRVTVHPDGALVTRRGRATARGGRVVVSGLPVLMDVAGLRVAVEGLNLRTARVGLSTAPERGEDPALESALAEAQVALASIRAELASLATERATAVGLSPAPSDELPPPPADVLRGWAVLVDAVDGWLEAIDAREAELHRALADAEVEVSRRTLALRQGSDEARWARWAPTREVVLDVDGDGDCEVELSYPMAGATWSPAYRLDADAAFSTARFTLRAIVAQATGEAWEGVEMRLSTVACRRQVQLPELPALRLGLQQPPRSSFRPLPEDFDELFPSELAVHRPPPSPPPIPEASSDLEIDELGAEPVASAAPRPQGRRREAPPPAPTMAPALAAPPPAPLAKMSAAPLRGLMAGAPRAAAAPAGGAEGGGGPPDLPDDELVVGDALLDYGGMRLGGIDASPGRRGRLRPGGLEEELGGMGVPDEVARRVAGRLRSHRATMDRVQALPLPTHHVRPDDGVEAVHAAQGRVTVPSDGRFHTVSVASRPLQLRSRWIAVPRHDPRVFRRVEATFTEMGALLPGPVEVSAGGALVATTPWKGRGAGASLSLDVGADDRLRLVRNVRYDEVSAGFFGGRRKMTTEVTVDIASARAESVRVEIRESVPVPVHGVDVVVELVEAQPRHERLAEAPDDKLKEGRWVQVVEVPAGGEARARLSYAVTLSDKEELVGGDRRG